MAQSLQPQPAQAQPLHDFVCAAALRIPAAFLGHPPALEVLV